PTPRANAKVKRSSTISPRSFSLLSCLAHWERSLNCEMLCNNNNLFYYYLLQPFNISQLNLSFAYFKWNIFCTQNSQLAVVKWHLGLRRWLESVPSDDLGQTQFDF